MYWKILKNILENPNHNGMVIFVLGILFLLSIYHFIFYYQQRDKSYLFYGLFAFTGFIAHLVNDKSGFIHDLVKPIETVLSESGFALIWINVLLYFIFGFTFVNLKGYSRRWYLIIFSSVYILMIIAVFLSVFKLGKSKLDIVYLSYMAVVVVLSIISYIPLFKLKHPLKNYIIIGSLFFFVSSITATFLISYKGDIGHTVFYVGLIVENITFSLGLGHKQKLIIQQKYDTQLELINQLRENEKLKNEVQEQLEKDVSSYSKQIEKEKLEKLEAKYKMEFAELKVSSLRSQMNPHFIFNSLNAIKLYIIDNDKENAVYYLNKFSKLIRKILATTREKEISLAEEIETLKLYIEIENIRFSNSIETNFVIDESIKINTIKIPSLILQPFVENALWHGLSSRKGNKKIEIRIKEEAKKHILIIIEDNGIGRKKAAVIKKKKLHKRDSIGIKLTNERLENFCKNYKNKYTLDFIDLYDENNAARGTKIRLRIPIK